MFETKYFMLTFCSRCEQGVKLQCFSCLFTWTQRFVTTTTWLQRCSWSNINYDGVGTTLTKRFQTGAPFWTHNDEFGTQEVKKYFPPYSFKSQKYVKKKKKRWRHLSNWVWDGIITVCIGSWCIPYTLRGPMCVCVCVLVSDGEQFIKNVWGKQAFRGH